MERGVCWKRAASAVVACRDFDLYRDCRTPSPQARVRVWRAIARTWEAGVCSTVYDDCCRRACAVEDEHSLLQNEVYHFWSL